MYMQACEQIGIPVVEKAPDPMRSHTWREAFVANWCAPMAPSLWRLCVQSWVPGRGRVCAVSAEMLCAAQCAGHAAATPHYFASLHVGSTWLPGACDSATAAGTVNCYEQGSSPLLVTEVVMHDDALVTCCRITRLDVITDTNSASVRLYPKPVFSANFCSCCPAISLIRWVIK